MKITFKKLKAIYAARGVELSDSSAAIMVEQYND